MSKIFRAVLRMATGLHAVCGISDEKMKEFEELGAPQKTKSRKKQPSKSMPRRRKRKKAQKG